MLETLRNLQKDDGGVALDEVLTMRLPVDYGTMTDEELLAYYTAIRSANG